MGKYAFEIKSKNEKREFHKFLKFMRVHKPKEDNDCKSIYPLFYIITDIQGDYYTLYDDNNKYVSQNGYEIITIEQFKDFFKKIF